MADARNPPTHPDTPAARRGATTTTHDRFAAERRGDGNPPGGREADPPLPHDADESSHSQASAAASHRPLGQQALNDIVEGRQDTDRGPVMDQVYNEKVAPHRGPAEPRR